MSGKHNAAPFAILRGSEVTLVEQVANGLRRCIATGYYKPGDTLPTTRDFAETLGVSRRITREAVGILVESGLISARPSVGCVVLGKNERTWRGSVLLVSRGDWGSYYVQKFAESFSALLLKQGYLVTQLTVPTDGNACDCSGLDAALTARYDLVFQIFDSKEIESHLAASGCRYVVLGDSGAPSLKQRTGSGFFSKSQAAGELVGILKSKGVHSVLVAGIMFYQEFKRSLKTARIETEWLHLPCLSEYASPEGVQRASLRGFQEWFETTPRSKYPDVILFTDDYTAAGALTVFDLKGVRIPEDVGVITMSNAGLGPVWHKELTRLEMTPSADGKAAADFACTLLTDGSVENEFILCPRYIKGGTF